MTVSAVGFFVVATLLVAAALTVVAAPRPPIAVGGLLALLLGLVAMDLVAAAPLLGVLQFVVALAPVGGLAAWGYRHDHSLLHERTAWVVAWPAAAVAAVGFLAVALAADAAGPGWYSGGAVETFQVILRHRSAPVAAALVVLVLMAALGAVILARVDVEEAHHERAVAERRARREREERRREDRARGRAQSGGEVKG